MDGAKAHFDIIIIGSGPAGFTAAIYGARGGVTTALFGGVAPGGQLLQTTEVENFPGFCEPIVGAELMERMLKQARNLGTLVLQEDAASVDLGRRPFTVSSRSGEVYTAGALVAATGAQARWLGLPTEEKYKGRGVCACATCDGFFYRGKEVCVIGGGDAAAEDALFLTRFATKVYLVHRRDRLRAHHRLQEKLRANPRIELIYEHVPEEITGEEKVTGITLRHVGTGQLRHLALPGVFVAIGHDPCTELFRGQLKLDENGYIVADSATTATSVPGVFAAGDVMDRRYKQAAVAVGSGCKAAMEALAFLEEAKSKA